MKAAERIVEEWNRRVPVGTAVRYWTGAKSGPGRRGETRSEAFALGGHTACVQVTGHAAAIALSHVELLEIAR